jgi:hypothetical protein
MIVEAMRRIRWRWVAWRALPALAVILVVAGAWAVGPWLAYIPQPVARRLTEGTLRALLIGYAATLTMAVLGTATLSLLIARARRQRRRTPVLARGLLLCGSCLLGLVGMEGMAAAWLGWTHRLPSLPTRFPVAPDDSVSIVVIGESSARGYPYNPAVSVGQIVGWQLGKVMPGRRFEVDVRARLGITLEQAHQDLAGLKRRPDVLIVYSGNNEFQARYEGTRDVGISEAPLDPVLGRLYRASLSSWLCRMIYETISKHRLGAPPPPLRTNRQLIEPPAVTPSETAAILADFRRRLDAIAAYCRRIGAMPILVIPPGNDAGWEPNRTVLPETVSKAERARLTREFEVARALEDSLPGDAEARYRALVERQPAFAEAHFRLARLRERAGDWDEARRHYRLARDLDGFPIRCPSPFQDIYRAVAEEHGAILIDGPAIVPKVSPHRLLDDHGFHDAHHPSLLGQIALAQAILDQLHARKAFGWPEGVASPRIDPAECIEHFAIDTDVWETVCGRSATFYRDFAPMRYDPTERRAKQAEYERAGGQIVEGTDPARTGIPSLAVP